MAESGALSVLISGCHSGPNPSAGLGVARSLRLAYPDAQLIAKDHSAHASGLHDSVFDDVWVCVSWEEVELERHREQIRARLEPQAWLVSTQDLEVRWLAEATAARVLVPPLDALNQTAKPEIAAAQSLPVRVPDWVPLSASDREIYAFCRAHNWRVWVKGSAYEAKSVESWVELTRARQLLGETWGEDGLFAQADVKGWEVSIAFSALHGELLDAVFMEKRLVTETGKTWAGQISDVPAALGHPLRDILAGLAWTGGGELEFVRDPEGGLWLIDWNPRFPAWVYGATLAGRNLPARLLAAASGLAPRPSPPVTSQFIRVVMELPVRAGLSLPAPPVEKPDPVKGGKHPSGMPLLMRRLSEKAWSQPVERPGVLPSRVTEDLREAWAQAEPTPYRALLRRMAEERFHRVAALAQRWPWDRVPLRVAYSVKTNPDWGLLGLARASGFLAEVISTAELRAARQAGFRLDHIVYNGPIPLDSPAARNGPVAAAFADSSVALQRYGEGRVAAVVGLRVRPPLLESRFGVRLESPEEFGEAVDIVRSLPLGLALGLSIHVPSSEVGPERWDALARAALYFGAALAELAGRTVEVLDLGGGWAAEDLEPALQEHLPGLIDQAQDLLPGLRQVIIEPGKSLVEPCEAVLCRVIEIRRRGDGTREAIVDASIAEVPLIHFFPHRLIAVSPGHVQLLPGGKDRVLGRLCMENDVLGAAVALPPWLAEGDSLAVWDSGAYDASMAYRFGLGAPPPDGELRGDREGEVGRY